MKLGLWALSGILLIGCTKQQADDAIILGTNATYPPYESVDADGKIVGFDIDVAKALAVKLGKKLIVQDMAFDALILALNQNKCDFIMAGISITPTRAKEIEMTPYQGEETKALTLLFWDKIPTAVTSLPDMQGKTIAVQAGSYMEHYLTQITTITAKPLESTMELVLDIQHGKSAAALVEPHIAKEVLGKQSKLKALEFALPQDQWVLGNGIGTKKGNTKLSTQIKEAIAALKSEGTIAQLEAKWFAGKVQ